MAGSCVEWGMVRVLQILGVVLPLVTLAACSGDAPPARPYSYAALDGLDRAALREQLAKHRHAQIERLEAYAAAARFPHNPSTTQTAHIFRDDTGAYCAVANMVHEDGLDALVASIAANDNALEVAYVNAGPMFQWILGSGLTQDELARIQLPLPPSPPGQGVRPAPTPKPPVRYEMNVVAEVRVHIARVLPRLRAEESESLDRAVERYIAEKARRGSGENAGKKREIRDPAAS